MARRIGVGLNVSSLLIILAAALFVLAAFDVDVGDVELIPLGLALFAAGHVV